MVTVDVAPGRMVERGCDGDFTGFVWASEGQGKNWNSGFSSQIDRTQFG